MEPSASGSGAVRVIDTTVGNLLSAVRAARVFVVFFIVFGLPASAWADEKNLFPISSPQRLSQFLMQREPLDALRQSHPIGLTVLSLAEEKRFSEPLRLLVDELQKRSFIASLDPLGANRLLRMVTSLPYRGRLQLSSQDPYWLDLNPSSDPLLEVGDRVFFPPYSPIVSVVLGSGEVCQVNHRQGVPTSAYVRACNETFARNLEWWPMVGAPNYWVAQADGAVFRVSASQWEDSDQIAPMEGAWIWAPGDALQFSDDFSSTLVTLLASQGPARDSQILNKALAITTTAPISLSNGALWDVGVKASAALAGQRAGGTSNDWGGLGYLQMPSARISEGQIRLGYSNVAPIKRHNLMLTPLPWMEFGFRYSHIDYERVGALAGYSVPWYLDKSIDVKLRLMEEGPRLPALSIGMVDFGGTGLFSSEYVVATKRFGNFEASVGAAFGYLRGSSELRNPLAGISKRFETRETPEVGMGGVPGYKSWFTGPMGLFAGLQWQPTADKLFFKAEIDSNDYQLEPFGERRERASPVNFGLVYMPTSWAEVSAGLERGNTLQFGVSFIIDAGGSPPEKVLDAPTLSAQPLAPGRGIENQLEAATLWRVESVSVVEDVAVVRLLSAGGYTQERLVRANTLLDLALPKEVKEFRYQVVPAGLEIFQISVARSAFNAEMTRFRSPLERKQVPVQTIRPDLQPQPDGLRHWRWNRLTLTPSLQYNQVLGSPERFWMYRVSAAGKMRWQFRDDSWVQGTLLYKLFDNMDTLRIPSYSALPRVRTNTRYYYSTSDLTMPNLQLTHVGSLPALGSRHFYGVYVGYLERMFAGVGAEYLYRPWQSKLAYGVDWNYVGQREFEQDFRLQSYRAHTGHLSVYWDTGYSGVHAKAMFGQYLAGDVGATIQLSRVFANGFTMGVWATKTNISAETFGEGSFDKGIFFSFPFDAVVPKTSNLSAMLSWRPLTRDGGAILGRSNRLHAVTSSGRRMFGEDEFIGSE